jgi:hypothetical protein
MFKKFLLASLFFISFVLTQAFSQSPYGRVLVLNSLGTQEWIDIYTVLANYTLYNPPPPVQVWFTNGNAINSGDFLGTTNNQPLIFKTNNTERMRLTESGDLQINGAFMPNGVAGNSGQVLTSQGSGAPPTWTTVTFTETDPVYTLYIDAAGATSGNLLRHNGTKFVPVASGNLTSTTSGVAITGGTGAVVGSGTTIDIATASSSTTGLLSSTDWNSFNNRWSLTGNSGTVDGTNFIGTTDNVPFNIRVNNQKAGRIASNGPTFFGYQAGNSNTATNNTGIGYQVLYSNTTGNNNTASGAYALYSNTTGYENTASGVNALRSNTTGSANTASGFEALYSNTTASQNVAIGNDALYTQSFNNGGTAWNSDNVAVGYQALYSNQPTSTSNGIQNTAIGNFALRSNTTGAYNTASGYQALYYNTTGNWNTANGVTALYSNTTGSNNTASGVDALRSNTTGSNNTADGVTALYYNSTGAYNTASGYQALYSNTTGNWNTANGVTALSSNTTGYSNTASGVSALAFNSTGAYNTASGVYALYYNASGNYNTASGYQALYSNTTGNNNTASGYLALYSNTGNNNTALGYNAGSNITTGSNNIAIGYNAQVPSGASDNQIRLGNTSITYAGIQVAWTVTSDKNLKENIISCPLGLNFISKLNPVSYIRKNDKHKKLEFGFIAQELDDVLKQENITNTGFVSIADDGTYSIRYNDFFAPIVKSIQELYSENIALKNKVEHLQQENEELKRANEKYTSELETLRSKIENIEKHLVNVGALGSAK